MDLEYNKKYFLNSQPNIFENDELRRPQIEGYFHIYDHFVKNNNDSHAIEIIPTGVGKTGLMGLFPYGISEGRVLIITPKLVIKDEVLDSLDPSHYENFWLKRDVFKHGDELPVVIEYKGDKTPNDVLESANIVILNIHKLQKRLDSSLINRVPKDFFDMIIIDEAHHSPAKTWVETTNHFNKSKVIKITGTPFRSDDEPIVGEVIYRYRLGAAMANGYVKSLEEFTYIPEELYLTIDDNDDDLYTEEEILDMGLKDKDWISRSVAYSKECSEKIVDASIKKLERKLENSDIPHKIIAVACSIKHAKQIKELYEDKGYKTAIIHSDLSDEKIHAELKKVENHKVKAVINVAMLGEGYDHPYLSIAAIFRPFKSKLPYVQFIGRILRIIPEEESNQPLDNIGEIISHKHLYLKELWNYYKNSIEEKETIIYLDEYKEQILFDEDTDSKDKVGESRNLTHGDAKEIGNGKLEGNPYLKTELYKKMVEEEKKRDEKIKELQEVLDINYEKAEIILKQTNSSGSNLKRPDLYFESRRQDLDEKIREEIVPELIAKFDIDKKGDNLKDCNLFIGKKSWIPKSINNNAGMLAVYFNQELKGKIGTNRENWDLSDMQTAIEQLPYIEEYVTGVLDSYLH